MRGSSPTWDCSSKRANTLSTSSRSNSIVVIFPRCQRFDVSDTGHSQCECKYRLAFVLFQTALMIHAPAQSGNSEHNSQQRDNRRVQSCTGCLVVEETISKKSFGLVGVTCTCPVICPVAGGSYSLFLHVSFRELSCVFLNRPVVTAYLGKT